MHSDWTITDSIQPAPIRRRWPAARTSCVARILAIVAACCECIVMIGCQQEMANQPRYEALEASSFFRDGLSARPLVEGTVARGHLEVDEHLYLGRVGGELAATFPFAIGPAELERGQERFNIYCSPCHDRAGSGRGIVVLRGFPAPPSFAEQRLREAPPGHFFEVMTNGYRIMPSYAEQVPPRDRWKIAAYIRALQLSQHASLDDAPPDERAKLEGTP